MVAAEGAALRCAMSALPVPAIGVGGIVFDDFGRVLLICRGCPPAVGAWSVPGGKQRAGESLPAACRREVYEETGLEVTVGPIVAVVERRIEGFHYVIIDFLASLQAPGSPRLAAADDATDARWVGLHELGGLPLVAGLERVIRCAERLRRSGSGCGLSDVDGGGHDFLAG